MFFNPNICKLCYYIKKKSIFFFRKELVKKKIADFPTKKS